MPTSELVLTIPREWWMNANQRLHWAQRKTRTANLRVYALAECQRQGLVKGLDSARIVVHLSYPRAGRHDAGNAAPTVKALVDGLIDYGVLPDDDDAHLVGPDLRNGGVTKGNYTVRLVVESLNESIETGTNAVS